MVQWFTVRKISAAEVKDAKFEEWSTAVETLEYSSETPMGEVTAAWREVIRGPLQRGLGLL